MTALTEAAGLQLLRGGQVGRIAYSDRALPAIVVVSYSVVNDAILIRCDASSDWSHAVLNAVVAFQADAIDADGLGWSVTCVGRTRAVPDCPDVLQLEPSHLQGWRISPEVVLAS
ncbi:pyridoxamine 5'-phosphate oxidase family protein [Acidothermaceae bacterium B102]|nr:pyridoxamine 5'-phosphate oxidase family protein [Acidothermaceae bacterium B102]